MRAASVRQYLPCALILLVAGILCPPALGIEERSGHLLELSMAYGDRHFDSATNLVYDAGGLRDVPDYSLPYALALLETGVGVSRAKAVVNAALQAQDTRGPLATRGLFKWYWQQDAPYDAEATSRVAPLLAVAYKRHSARLGDDLAGRVRAAMELALSNLQRRARGAGLDDEGLQLVAAIAQIESALGGDAWSGSCTTFLARWSKEISTNGRTWGSGASADALRLLALERIWEVSPEASRGTVDDLLELCYRDFAQRVVPGSPVLAGPLTHARSSEYVEGQSAATYLIYRDFGGSLPINTKPVGAALALSGYRPSAAMLAACGPRPEAYSVQTNATREREPASANTFMHKGFTLGTMTGWCFPDTVPIFATFPREQSQPTAYFMIRGAPAHISSLQYGNLAICSFNFDRMSVNNRLQAWVRGYLGSVHDIEEVYALGTEWNGEPMAVGARGTVVVKRGGVYLAVTLLEAGPLGSELEARRKPGVLEWQGIGEHATLTLTTYARQYEYALRRPEDDLRCGVIVQIWDGDQFETTRDVARWLAYSKISQRAAQQTAKTSVPRDDLHPILDEHKPQPKRQYKRWRQTVHTVEYSYQRGKGDSFVLVEDLRNEVVLARYRNEQSMGSGLLWQSPALSLTPGQSIAEALAPQPPKPEPAVEPEPAIEPGAEIEPAAETEPAAATPATEEGE